MTYTPEKMYRRIEARLDRIEKMLADLADMLASRNDIDQTAGIKIELAQVRAQGGDIVQYLKERGKKQRRRRS